MKREMLLVGALACALSLPIMGCGGETTTSGNGAGESQSQGQGGDFDAVDAYWGQWRGSVDTVGETIYGDAAGTEPMLDVNLEQDGTCTVEPLDTHPDLLSDSGTWEGTESEVTLHLDGAGDVVLTVVDKVTLEGAASDFGIADFDVISLDFYG